MKFVSYNLHYAIDKDGRYDLERIVAALEGVIYTPLGALRVYNLHFGSVSGGERRLQADCVLGLVREAPSQSGAWSGPNGEFAERGRSADRWNVPCSTIAWSAKTWSRASTPAG